MAYIYLDYAATTPMDPLVFAAMEPYFKDKFYNPSAQYGPAREVARDIANARAKVAHWFGAKPAEIVFTAGGTEANNLAIAGIMDQYPSAEIAVLGIEHEAVLEPAKKYIHQTIKVNKNGIADLDDLLKVVTDNTVLVSIMYANNEIGTVQPVRRISLLLETIRRNRRERGIELPLYFHTDASQAAAYLDLHARRLGVDMITINGSKIYGPKQVGALYVNSRVRLNPQMRGGGQERGLRSGTENVAGIIGLATALDLVQGKRYEEVKRLSELQQFFAREIKSVASAVKVNGSLKQRLPSNVHVTFPGQDNERLMILLEQEGILCAAGSACSAASGEPSHVLTALGLDDVSARASLRFTFGNQTTKVALERVLSVLQHLI